MKKALLLIAFLFPLWLSAQNANPIAQPYQTFLNPNTGGAPCAGCLLYTYAAGTTTPLATYTDSTGNTPNTNPIVLDVAGGAQIWVKTSAIKFVLKDALGTTLWSADNIYPNACTTTGCTFTGPITGTSATFSGSVAVGDLVPSLTPVIDIRSKGAKIDGVTDDTAAWQAAISAAEAVNGIVYMPQGTSLVSSALVITAPVQIRGNGFGSTVLFSSSTPLANGFDFEGVSFGGIDNLSVIGATSPATLARAITVNNSQNVTLDHLNIQGGGWAIAGGNPRAQVNIQSSTNIKLTNSVLTDDGGTYVVVTDYLSPTPLVTSSNITISHNRIIATTANIDIAGFAAQLSDFSDNYIDGGNRYAGGNNNGYGILSYNHGPLSVPTSGATINGTTTLTLTFPANTLPTTPIGYYNVTLASVTTCTGTQPNGTFQATITSPTTITLSSSGSTCSSASLGAATMTADVHPSHVTIARNRILDTAGSCVYIQTSDYSSVANNVLENCDQQQLNTSLPAGGIAVNAGTGQSITGNTIRGSGQVGIDLANPSAISVTGNTATGTTNAVLRAAGVTNGIVSGNNLSAGTYGIYAITGTSNTMFDNFISNVTYNGELFDSSTANNVIRGNVSTPQNMVGLDDSGNGNRIGPFSCYQCTMILGGSNTIADSLKFSNLTSGSTALSFRRASHIRVKNASATNISQFLGALGISSDVECDNCSSVATGGAGYLDASPATFTGTVTSGSCTITGLSVTTMSAGQILSDFSGSAYIPSGSTITSVNAGASSLVFSNPQSACATGTSTETINYYASWINGFTLHNLNLEGNFPTVAQGFVSYASQNLHLEGGSFTGFPGSTGNSSIGIRDVSCTVNSQCSINSNLRIDNGSLGSGITISNQPGNVTVSNVSIRNVGSWALQDIGTGTGNSFFGIQDNAAAGSEFNMTNANSKWATLNMYGSGAPASTCNSAHNGYIYFDTSITGPNMYLCNGSTWLRQFPLTGTTGSIGGAALTAGQAATGTASITGATTSMACAASAAGGTAVGAGFIPSCQITAAGTATVSVTATVAGTPVAATYNVRVIQ